jgi:NAD(P)-dependent dehydrogenase (short-subunit alcohol dehydrogenase family)
MNSEFKGRVALVAGGSRGIGLACVETLLAAGACVAAIGRDPVQLNTLSERFGTESFLALQGDLTVAGTEDTMVAQVLERFSRLDILINSAGSSGGGQFVSVPDSVWQSSFDLKIMGTVRLIRAVLPHMQSAGYGWIVSIAGNSALHHNAQMLPSAMANVTLLSVTKGLATQMAPHGLVINSVSPGPTLTDRLLGLFADRAAEQGVPVASVEKSFLSGTPNGQFCQPADIARSVLFLCSPLNRQVVGINLTVDGGATL